MWFQQHGGTCQQPWTIQLLHETLWRVQISFLSSELASHIVWFHQNWPPTLYDLTPLVLFLWGYLKSKVYTNKPTTTCAFKGGIKLCVNKIQPLLCRMVMENFKKKYFSKISKKKSLTVCAAKPWEPFTLQKLRTKEENCIQFKCCVNFRTIEERWQHNTAYSHQNNYANQDF